MLLLPLGGSVEGALWLVRVMLDARTAADAYGFSFSFVWNQRCCYRLTRLALPDTYALITPDRAASCVAATVVGWGFLRDGPIGS